MTQFATPDVTSADGAKPLTGGVRGPQPPAWHIPELQSLRGLAALVVLLHHCSFLFMTDPVFRLWSMVLLNAHAAVVLFFVLSGYVLARALDRARERPGHIVDFYIARGFRIYPAVWIASLAAMIYFLLGFLLGLPAPRGTSPWFDMVFQGPRTLSDYVLSFLGLRNYLLAPMWSIRMELIGSALMPVVVFLLYRGLGPILLALSCFVAVYFFVAVYLPCFIAGAVAFRYQAQLGRLFGHAASLTAALCVLLFFRSLRPEWSMGAGFHEIVPTLAESFAAAALIIGLVERPVQALRSKSAIRLGDISFSVYLLHFLVMGLLAKAVALLPLGENALALVLMATTLAVTLPLAALFFEKVEKPGIRLGKWASGVVVGFYNRALGNDPRFSPPAPPKPAA